MSISDKRKAKVAIVPSDDGLYLQARIVPEMADHAVTREWFQQQLNQEQYKDYYLLDDGVKKALEVCAKNDREQLCNFARIKPAAVELSFSSDDLYVVATVIPKSGREPFSQKTLANLLKQNVYRQHLLIEGAGDGVERACMANDKPQEINIARKHEMLVSFEVSKNEKGVNALLTPCACLEKVTEQSIRERFAKDFDRFRIVDDQLKQVLTLCEANATKTKIQIADRKYASVKLEFSEAKQAVIAAVIPCGSETAFDKNQIIDQLSDYPEQMLVEKEFNLLMKSCADNQSPSHFAITTVRPALLEFRLSESGESVIANGTARRGEEPVSMKLVQQGLANAGFKNFEIQDKAYSELEKRCTENTENFSLEIAKKLHASVELEIEKTTGKQLLARITPHATIIPLTQETLLEKIVEFEDYVVTSLGQAMMACLQNDRSVSVPVAVKREPLVTLALDDDRQYIQCHIVPAKGKEPITRHSLERQLRVPEYINYYPLKDNISQALDLCDKNAEEQVINIARVLQARVLLEISDSGRHLVAKVDPKKTPEAFSMDWLNKQLKQDVYREYFIIEEAAQALLEMCLENEKQGRINIAEKRETAVSLAVTAAGDGVDAQLEPCSGPDKVTRAWIEEQFNQPELIRFRLIEEALKQLLGECDENRTSGVLRIAEKRDPEVKLQFDAQTNKVTAVMKPCCAEQPVDRAYLKKLLADNHYDRYFLYQENFETLLNQCLSNENPLTIEIAEKKDGELDLHVADGEFPLSAYVIYSRAYGGKEITEQQVDEFFKAHKITTMLLADQVGSLKSHLETVSGPSCWLIARGKDVVNGLDTQFIWLAEEGVEENVSKADETGRIDLRKARNVAAVKPGDRVMRLDPPTKGEPGISIFGETIEPQPGQALPYTKDLQGTKVDDKDARFLVATINGAPVVVEHGMHVLEVFLINEVNMATGDINFDGNVMVKGDIETGSTIECTGNLTVGGTIENATLKVRGDLVVGGGIVGEAPAKNENAAFLDETLPWHTRIEVWGDVHGKYISNSLLVCRGNINVSQYVSHSVLLSKKEIHVGSKSSSSIIGGKTRATLLVESQNIGNESEVKTLVQVGSLKALQEKKTKLTDVANEKQATLDKLRQVFELLQKQAGDADSEKREKLQNTIAALTADIKKYSEAVELLDKTIESYKEASIVLHKTIYGGVTVSINDIQCTYSDKTAVNCLKVEEGEIVSS